MSSSRIPTGPAATDVPDPKLSGEGAALTPRSLAFFDESGGLDTGHFVVGGYVGPAEMWTAFSEDWNRVLAGPPAWPPFHAVECESGKEGFEVLDDRERKLRIGQLVGVIAKHKPTAVLAVLNVPRFKAAMPPVERGNMKKQLWKHHPYSFCAAQLFGNLCQLEDHVGEAFGTIDVVFGPLDKKFVGAAGDEIRKGVLAALQEDSPEHARRLGTPSWSRVEQRAEHVPLQAADLLVWHVRRRWDEPDGIHRRALRELKKATTIRYCAATPGIDLQGIWASTGH